MKLLFFISLMLFSTLLWSASGWKVIAETTSCSKKIQILGKEGEKYVVAIQGENKLKLYPQDGSNFSENTMGTTEFNSEKVNDSSYHFIQPSYVEGNLPKIDITHAGKKERCKMELTRSH